MGRFLGTKSTKTDEVQMQGRDPVLSVYQFVFPLVGTPSGVATAVRAQCQLAGCYLIESSMLF